jgi:uncharacterized RDD family membrane protein YckC
MNLAQPAATARYTWERDTLRTASTTRRAFAFTVDALAIFALAWTLSFAAASAGLLRIPDMDLNGVRSPVMGLFWIVSIFELPILLLYTTLFEGLVGRTPGKLLAGLRIARVDGATPTLGDAFLRNLLRLLWVTPFGPAFILLDAWTLRATELDQRLGDLAAGTVVIHTRDDATP